MTSGGRSITKRIAYSAAHVLARLTGVIGFRLRVWGREHVPREGGVLVCSNHQSYFDPVLAGLACDRHMNYLARKSLFKFAPFRWLIQLYDAIPIDRDGFSLEGIKETLRRLKRNEMVLIFPEGTRTETGEMASLKPGFTAIARRGKSALLPIGIAGSYDSWPRGQWLPGLAPIHIVIGEPLTAGEVAELSDDQLILELESRMRHCFLEAQRGR